MFKQLVCLDDYGSLEIKIETASSKNITTIKLDKEQLAHIKNYCLDIFFAQQAEIANAVRVAQPVALAHYTEVNEHNDDVGF